MFCCYARRLWRKLLNQDTIQGTGEYAEACKSLGPMAASVGVERATAVEGQMQCLSSSMQVMDWFLQSPSPLLFDNWIDAGTQGMSRCRRRAGGLMLMMRPVG
jgi:hypothetical protein